MKKFLSNSINMIRTVLSFLTNNPAPTAGIPAFTTAQTTVANKLVLIDSLNQIAEGTSIGVTLDTNIIREAMSQIAFRVGSAVAAYAGSVNNNTLRLKVDFTMAKLNKFKKDEVDDICQQIHNEADANIAAAGAFGYTPTDVTDLQTAINLYRTSVQNPRQAIISKTDAIDNIELLVKEIKETYFRLQMDKMVNTVIAVNPQFVNSYFLAREIIDLGVTHAKIRGTVKDENDVPLIGVLFQIRNAATNELFAETLSGLRGAFGISPVTVGDYNLTWSFNGYQTITESNVHISAGKELQRRIVLDALLVREGDLAAGAVTNIDVAGLNLNDNSMVTVQVTGSAMKFYASPAPNDAPGAVLLEVAAGQTLTKTAQEFGADIGFGGANQYLNALNAGGGQGHYRLTFEL